jgi:hypothetical protein
MKVAALLLLLGGPWIPVGVTTWLLWHKPPPPAEHVIVYIDASKLRQWDI